MDVEGGAFGEDGDEYPEEGHYEVVATGEVVAPGMIDEGPQEWSEPGIPGGRWTATGSREQVSALWEQQEFPLAASLGPEWTPGMRECVAGAVAVVTAGQFGEWGPLGSKMESTVSGFVRMP